MRWMQAATIMGRGAARSVQVDVSALGRAVSGSLLMIDKHTMVSSGPTAAAESPTAQMTITLNRYAVAFLSLKPGIRDKVRGFNSRGKQDTGKPGKWIILRPRWQLGNL